MTDFDIWIPRLLKSLMACVVSTVLGTFLIICAVILLSGQWLPSASKTNFFNFEYLSSYELPAIIALSYMIFGGLPLQALMQRFKLNGWISFLVAGGVAGLCLAALLDYAIQTQERQGIGPVAWEIGNISWVLYGYLTLFGVLYAGLAWLIRRPDKDHTSGDFSIQK